jgi:hypothetical protein
MQTYSFIVELRIWHPNVDPAAISAELGVQPKFLGKAGERRKTRSGTVLAGTWRESYWSGELFQYGECLSHERSIEDVLSEAIEELKPHQAFLLQLQAEGGRLLLQASSYSNRNYALELSPAILGELCALGLGFAHDVYPCAQRW